MSVPSLNSFFDPSSIQIVHQDARVIAVSKPAGMVIHRGWGQDGRTLADILRDDIVKAPVFGVQRLDRGTSGIVLFALDSAAARDLQVEFESKQAHKRYIALVRGPMTEACIVDHHVLRRDGHSYVDAVTEFDPVAHIDRWSLVEARPLTGRLHQIRRHLKHLSHPIVGDVKYGKGEVNRHFREQFGLHRLALHAFELCIKHPNGETLVLRAPLTPDFAVPLERMGAEVPAHLL